VTTEGRGDVTVSSYGDRAVVEGAPGVIASFSFSMTRANSPALDPATRLLKERVKRTFAHLPKALAGDEEEIHQMRVAARRLRTALPILRSSP
jgi:hypothetical protein